MGSKGPNGELVIVTVIKGQQKNANYDVITGKSIQVITDFCTVQPK